jgi:hypothetical protein
MNILKLFKNIKKLILKKSIILKVQLDKKKKNLELKTICT